MDLCKGKELRVALRMLLQAHAGKSKHCQTASHRALGRQISDVARHPGFPERIIPGYFVCTFPSDELRYVLALLLSNVKRVLAFRLD